MTKKQTTATKATAAPKTKAIKKAPKEAP